MDLRSLRYTDGKSDKFWTIRLVDCAHTVQYGRYGTAGQTQTKEFPSAEAARRSYEKLVAEKLKKGYHEDGAIASSELAVSKPMPTEIPENWRSLALMEIQGQLVQDKKQLCELAAIDAIPDEYWGLLNVEVRKAISSQSDSATRLWRWLAKDQHDTVRQAIAANSNMCPDILEKLAEDTSQVVRVSLLKNPNVPDSVFIKLSEDPYSNIRKLVREHRRTPGEVLMKMMSEFPTNSPTSSMPRDRWIPLTAAERKNTSSETLIQLSQHPDSLVRFNVAVHPNTPIEVLKVLSSAYDSSYGQSFQPREGVARNSNTPVEILRELSKVLNPNVRCSVAVNPKTPLDLLEELLEREPDMYYPISKNPSTPEHLLRNIFSRLHPSRFEQFIKHPNAPADCFEEALKSGRMDVFHAVAKSPKTSPELLENLLSEDFQKQFNLEYNAKFIDVKYEVAANPNASQALLERLYEHFSPSIDFFLASNPNLSAEILGHIADDSKSSAVLLKIIEHKNVTLLILEKLSRQHKGMIRTNALETYYAQVATKSNIPKADLEYALQTNNTSIRRLIIKHPQGKIEALREYAQVYSSLSYFLSLHHDQFPVDDLSKIATTSWVACYAIAQNPSTPKDLLETLAQDEHPFVQAAARSALGIEVITTSAIAAIPESIVDEEPKTSEVIPVELKIERSIDLDPNDKFWATWQFLEPKPSPPAKPFDLQDALTRFKKIAGKAPDRHRKASGYFSLDWNKAEISPNLSVEEAHFWLVAMVYDLPGLGRGNAYFTKDGLEQAAVAMAAMDFHTLPTFKDVILDFLKKSSSRGVNPFVIRPIHQLFSSLDFILEIHHFHQLSDQSAVDYIEQKSDAQYLDDYVQARSRWSRDQAINALAVTSKRDCGWTIQRLIEGFRYHVCPYLNQSQVEAMKDRLKLALDSQSSTLHLYKLAAYLGLHETAQQFIKSWQVQKPYGYHITTPLGYLSAPDAAEIILGSGSSDDMIQHARQFSIAIGQTNHMRAWLARTGLSALDVMCRSIETDEQVAVFSLVKAPEVAPYMMELWLSLKKPQPARQWLEDHLNHAIVGLIPIAVGVGHDPVRVKLNELQKAAIEFLQSLKRKGYESLIRAALAQEKPDIADKVRDLLFSVAEEPLTPFDLATTPQWLTAAILELPNQKRSKSPDWVSFADLPTLAIGDRALTSEQITATLTALRLSTLDSPLALIRDLKTHATPNSLDTFAWSLFERWLAEGAPNKEKWAMHALGFFGSDHIALKLTPLIRNWPGESQHARAVVGLECLRAIGSDTALMQIHGIAQKIKFQGLKARAQDCMAAIARDRQLTPHQLADRIIPDCGLGETGQRSFDFGSRQFQFFLSADLKPMLRDPQGKILTTLPKPNSKDDSEKAAAAIADWKLVKKQVSEVVKLHSFRLETAMVEGRTWSGQEFVTLLVQHPLMTHLVQRIIWSTYDAEGNLQDTFRVAEDRTFTDAHDNLYQLDPAAIVGIPHPLLLTPTTKSQWGTLIDDYSIFQPFPQITRDTYELTPEERNQTEIKRFDKMPLPGAPLVRIIENQGWLKGALHDHGDYQVHYKYFSQGDVTAIIGDYETLHVEQSSIWGDVTINGCLFVQGLLDQPYKYPRPGSWYAEHSKITCLTLDQVNPIVISEVIRDITLIILAKDTGKTT